MDKVPKILRANWNSVRENILAHYTGDLKKLADIVVGQRDEGEEVTHKRIQTLKAVTQEHITSAINQYKGFFRNYDYSINVELGEIDSPFGKAKIEDYYLSEGVEFILTRPNSFIFPLPYVDGYLLPSFAPENLERKIELLEIFSEDILSFENEVIFSEGKSKWKVDKENIYILLKNKDALTLGFDAPRNDEYSWFIYSAHFYDGLPIVVNGGYSNSVREKSYGRVIIYKFFTSIFTPIIPIIDDYLTAWSDMKMVNTYHSTPKAQVLESDCNNCNGTGYSSVSLKGKTSCEKCNGSGKVTSFLQSTGAYVTKPKLKTGFADGDVYPKDDALKYITPPTGSLEYFAKQEETKYKRLRKALFLEFDESASASGESKKESKKKAENTYKWVGEMIFGNLKKLYEIVQSYQVPQVNLREPIIVKTPLDYSVKSESDLLASVNALPSTAPSSLKKHTLNEYLSKIYQKRPFEFRINEILYKFDILYGADENTVTDFKLSYLEGAEDLEYIIMLHYKGEMFLRQVEDLLELTDEQVKELLTDEFSRANTVI